MVATRTSCTFLFQCPSLCSPSVSLLFHFIPFLTLPISSLFSLSSHAHTHPPPPYVSTDNQ